MRAAFLSIFIAVAVAGCGPANRRVWGDVSYAGKPVEDGTIEFIPADRTAGPSTGGPIVSGHYDVPAAVGPLPGGVYKVTIRAMAKTGKSSPDPFNPSAKIEQIENYIPAIYNTNTTLKVTISPRSGENQHDFHLELKH